MGADYLFETVISFHLDVYPEVRMLDHMVVGFFVFLFLCFFISLKNFHHVSIVAVLIYTPITIA